MLSVGKMKLLFLCSFFVKFLYLLIILNILLSKQPFKPRTVAVTGSYLEHRKTPTSPKVAESVCAMFIWFQTKTLQMLICYAPLILFL